ncbi:MAG: Rieske (2Fe-2S) protein [Paracoccaceae bacterium]
MPTDDTPISGGLERPLRGGTNRRKIIVGGAALVSGFGALAPETAMAAGADDVEKAAPQPGDRFLLIKGEFKNELLRADMLEPGGKPVECFPFDTGSDTAKRKNRLNRSLVLRLDPAEMDDDTRALSADGLLLYSAVCTHKGCTIKSWMEEERRLRCHCHLSEFAALTGGDVMSGPAKYQLPMIPLAVDDEGFVVATAGFTSEPGGKTK